MLRLGLVLALVGAGTAVIGNPIWKWYYETMLPGEELVFGMEVRLQQALLVGGLFMAIGSIMVKHFEILKDDLQAAAGGTDRK